MGKGKKTGHAVVMSSLRILLLFLLTAAVVLSLGSCESYAAEQVAVVYGFKAKAYDDLVNGLKDACRQCAVTTMRPQDVSSILKTSGFSAILSLGSEAFSATKDIAGIPIFYTMAFLPKSEITTGANLHEIPVFISPKRQLEAIRKMTPSVKKVGVIFSDVSVRDNVEEAASSVGISVVLARVDRMKDVPKAYKRLAGRIDMLLVVPDPVMMSGGIMEYLMTASIESGIPVAAFSLKYVDMGAVAGFYATPYDVGSLAGKRISDLFAPDQEKGAYVAKLRMRTAVNTVTAHKLGIFLNLKGWSGVRIVR